MARPEHKINELKRIYLLTNNPSKDRIIDDAINALKALTIEVR